MDREGLADAIEQYHAAADEFVRGNPEPQKAVFSHADDVTLVNPLGVVARGWDAVAATMDRASSQFAGGKALGFDRLAENLGAEIAYICEIEHWQAKVGAGDEMSSGALRVTSIFRREGRGEWKVVHRHADPITTLQPPASLGAAD